MLRELFDDLRHHDSVLWRRAVDAGVTYGPDAWVRYSPPFFGLAFAAALPRQRRAVRDNLRRALGARAPLREAWDVARVFTNYASSLTDAFVAGSERGDPLSVRCLDEPTLRAVRDEGRGMILATAHTGGWQVAGRAFERLLGAELLVVMRRERDPRAQSLQEAARARAGVRFAYVGDDPLEALGVLGHLRRRGVVAMQMDRLPPGMRGRRAELFGAAFHVPEGPLRLASVSGAPIVPVFTRRLGYMDYDVQVAPPVRLPRRPATADLDAASSAVLRAMEAFVRANPTQWFHFE
jgi:phosphatidylinositol dimannoside acyltransferase